MEQNKKWKNIRITPEVHGLIRNVSMLERRTLSAVIERAIKLYKQKHFQKFN